MGDTYLDAFNLLCGEKIGSGVHRDVFACRIRQDLVVKVETYNDRYRYFANVIEEKFWDDHRWNKAISRWLAPCEFLSPDGRILLQKKCEPITSAFKVPTKIPSFLTDTKLSNFGLLNGKLVCVDYALVITNPSLRLKKVEFYD